MAKAKLNLIQSFSKLFKNVPTVNALQSDNAFNKAFYRFVGGGYTDYDREASEYIERGYNENSTVYAVVQQMSTKAASVPLFIQNSKTKKEAKRITQRQEFERKNILNFAAKFSKKSFDTVEDDASFLPPPLERPNPSMSWVEFFSLAETMLRLTGNIYFYMPTPLSEFATDKSPYAIYILPSHLMQIVLKSGADMIIDSNPVSHYVLTEGYAYDEFMSEDVVHITFANPNFNMNGSHLYGQAPLRAAMANLQVSNETTKQNAKTMQNAGVYGFIHGKSVPLQPAQAKELKDRLNDMDKDPSRMSRIAGISSEIGFTQMNLSTKDLLPFDYLDYSEKELANVLGWSTLLLNNTSGAKYDNLKQIRQRVVTDTIMPDLGLIEDALNSKILPRFKGYETAVCYFDFSLLPEMQADMAELVGWLTIALRDGAINRNEYREAISYEAEKGDQFNEFSVQFGLVPLEDAFTPPEDLNIGNEGLTVGTEEDEDEDEPTDEKKTFVRKEFDPDQPRDKGGKWTKWGRLHTIEGEIRHDKLETAIYVDADGKILGTQQGTADNVPVQLPDGTWILSHNHPNDSSFSRQDLIFLMNNEINTIRVVTPSGLVFQAFKKEGVDFSGVVSEFTKNGGYWQQAQDLANKEVEDMAYKLYSNDPDFLTYWKIREKKLAEVQKIFGTLSERQMYHLMNSTPMGELLGYTKVTPKP